MPHLILSDLECPFCQRCILFVQKRDPKKKFIFSSLDGKAAKQMEQILSIHDKESLILIEDYNTPKQEISYRSKAVFTILWELGGIWKLGGWKKILPPIFFDWLYRIVAKNRKRLCKKNASYQSKFDKKRFIT